MKLSSKTKVFLEYGAIAIFIMLPLLKPGYILTLDLIFGPKMRMPSMISNTYPFELIMHGLNFAVPSQIIEKLLLLLILTLSGFGMHFLLNGEKKIGNYFAGILYMVNPFTYSRFMDGQVVLLMGYALMPFFLKSLWSLLKKPELKESLKTASLAVLIAFFSIHYIFFMALFAFISIIFIGWQNSKQKDYFKNSAKSLLLVAILFVLANSFWLIPIFKGTSQALTEVKSFDAHEYTAFQTTTDPHFGVLFNAAALYGHWGDRQFRYVLPKNVVPGWYLIAGVFIALAFTGVILGFKKRKVETTILGVTALIAWVLGVGVAYGPFSGLFYFLVHHVPLFQGFRDSQKFIGLVCLAYAYLGGYALSYLLVKTKGKRILTRLLPVLLILPILYTPNIFWGFGGQLKPVNYPSDWSALNTWLNADKDNFKVLFLPWHQYLSFPFTGRVIANPAKMFFDKPVIQGDMIEFEGIWRTGSDPETIFVEQKVLRRYYEITDAGHELNSLKIKYIVVAKTFDYKNYKYLDNQTDLELISDTDTLKMYLNKSFTEAG